MKRIPIYRKTPQIFILHEFGLYFSQIIIFSIVGIFASDFLKNEDRLVAYVNTRFNGNSPLEFLYVIFATLSVIGVLKVIDEVVEHKVLKGLITDVVNEIPKIIYFFGSSVAGLMLTITMFLYKNPNQEDPVLKFALFGVFFAVVMFVYGALMIYFLKKKTYIRIPEKQK